MPRPVGVTLISLLYFLVAFVLVICAVVFLGLMGVAGLGARAHEMGPLALVAGLGAVASVVCVLLAFIVILVGWGLWTLKSWARIVALIFAGLGLAGGVLSLLAALFLRSPMLPAVGMVGAVLALVRIAINALIFWYLTLPQVKEAFVHP